MFKLGLILGVLTGLLILQFVSIGEFLYLKIRLKKYHIRLTIFDFLFKYYDVIYSLKIIETCSDFFKSLERKDQ